jgi:hypothetical protein
MKLTLILTTAVAGVVLAVPSASSAQLPPPQTRDFATGSGSTAQVSSFNFEVSSGPSGENPTGSGTAVSDTPFPGTVYTVMDVVCLSVTGSAATVVERLAENVAGIPYAKVTVVDNGPAGSNLDTFTPTLLPFGTFPFPAPDCSTPALPGIDVHLTSGDIIVHDAPPLPTTKDQCKDGGWPQFGFANLGQCVAFVERGPGPQEASGTG